MAESINLDAILNAINFAVLKHHGQVRKDECASPYITHPLSVAREIYTTGKLTDQNLLLAAILHDTLEDTHTSAEEIEASFGNDVLTIVFEVTDDKSLDKALRKRLQVMHAAELSYPARVLKLADKLVNCRDILHTPPKKWSLKRRQDYLQWAADVIAQIRHTNPHLEAAFDHLLAEAETHLGFHLEPFETVHTRPWGPPPENSAQ